MRLICPKCDAQYDIADDVIPEGGRDVQCSSCAHTWFQMDKPKIAGRPLTQRPTPRPTPSETDDGPKHKPIDATVERKPLDSSIADILREEAAREKEVRATEEARPHPADDTGMSASERAEETRKRIAAMTGDAAATPAAVAAAATGAVQGANLRTVPDIEEINATQVVHRRGFRRGFFMVLFLMAILIAPYFFADQITENLPQTQEIMTTYVQIVDEGRVWLNEQVQTVRAMVEEMMAASDTAVDAPAEPDATAAEN